MAAPLRPTLAAGNVVLLGRIRSFNLRATGKDLLRRSVDVGLHDDGLLTARPCRSSVSWQRTGIHALEPFAAVVARAGSGHDGLNAFHGRSRSTSTSRKATCVPPLCVRCPNLGAAVS